MNESEKFLDRSGRDISVTGWQQKRDSTGPDTSGRAVEPGESVNPEVEEILLSDMTRWREQLARSIARNNYAMRGGEIVTAVNQIIFQLLFVQIAEDRGLVGSGILEKILAAGEPYAAYRKASQKIDDAWMYPRDGDRNKSTPAEYPVIEDRVLTTILSRLCSAERPYHFASIPTEVIAQIFDRYLARTVRRSATHKVIVVATRSATQSGEHPEHPPPPMIDYLVQSTLDAVLSSRSEMEILPIRVLDPACGAGVTLLHAYNHLIDVTGPANISFAEKKEILLNSIHGVDIDRQCIAAAKLLLVIKLLENERAESLPGDFFTICKEVFPELRHTIQSGNSLVGPEIASNELWPFCPLHERHSLNIFDWKTSFPEIYSSGGFDAIIGIPPRGFLESQELIQRYFQQHYAVYHPRADRSGYFLERGLSLLRRNGELGFVMNDQWFRGKNSSFLRSALRMSRIEEIVLFGEIRETEKNPASCIIRVAHSPPQNTFFVTYISPSFKGQIACFIRLNRFTVDSSALDNGGWIFRDTRIQDIITKTQKSGIPLEEVVMGQVFEGIEIGTDEPLVIDKKIKEQLVKDNPECGPLIRPFVAGKEIDRYQIPVNPKYLVFIPPGWATSNVTSASCLYSWLKKRHPSLARSWKLSMKNSEAPGGVGDKRAGTLIDEEFWFGTHPKIFFRNRFENPAFAFDEGKTVPDNATSAIASSSLYLLGLLNSRLLFFLFNNFIPNSGTAEKLHSWEDLRNLPIYMIDFDDPDDKIRHDRMLILVTEILKLHKHLTLANTDREKRLILQEIDSTDKQIDSLVYGLYGLTADEIAVVEESVSKESSSTIKNEDSTYQGNR
jgi:hypothetical protein